MFLRHSARSLAASHFMGTKCSSPGMPSLKAETSHIADKDFILAIYCFPVLRQWVSIHFSGVNRDCCTLQNYDHFLNICINTVCFLLWRNSCCSPLHKSQSIPALNAYYSLPPPPNIPDRQQLGLGCLRLQQSCFLPSASQKLPL